MAPARPAPEPGGLAIPDAWSVHGGVKRASEWERTAGPAPAASRVARPSPATVPITAKAWPRAGGRHLR